MPTLAAPCARHSPEPVPSKPLSAAGQRGRGTWLPFVPLQRPWAGMPFGPCQKPWLLASQLIAKDRNSNPISKRGPGRGHSKITLKQPCVSHRPAWGRHWQRSGVQGAELSDRLGLEQRGLGRHPPLPRIPRLGGGGSLCLHRTVGMYPGQAAGDPRRCDAGMTDPPRKAVTGETKAKSRSSYTGCRPCPCSGLPCGSQGPDITMGQHEACQSWCPILTPAVPDLPLAGAGRGLPDWRVGGTELE